VFAERYADQNKADFHELKDEIASGRVDDEGDRWRRPLV